MMRGIVVVVTALMAVLFLGEKKYFHHIMSLVFIVVGVGTVGVVSILAADDSDSNDSAPVTTSVFGILMLLLA